MNQKIVSDYHREAKYLAKELIENVFGENFVEFLNERYFNSLYRSIYRILAKNFQILSQYKVVNDKILGDISEKNHIYFTQIKNIFLPERMRGEEYDMVIWYAIGKDIERFNEDIATNYLHTYKPRKFEPLPPLKK